MILKHKKILIGGVIAAVTIGTLTGILVPLLSKESQNDDEKTLLSYESLVAKIIAAKDEQEAKDQAMKLYGLELKNDDAISSLKGGEKERYDAALALGVYIFANKDDYKIRVYEGKDKNALKQLLLVFKTKTSQVASQANATADWPINKIDIDNDAMAFLYTIFKDKFVHGKFQAAKIENPVPAASDFKTKEYEILQLYYVLKAQSPPEDLFNDYNMAIDDKEYVIKKFKDYMMSLLNPTPSYVTHDDLSVEAKMEGAKAASNKAPGKITFKYGGLKEIINDFSFTHNEGYPLEIKTGSESKVANEVRLGDIKFASSVSSDVEIYHVGVSSKKTDGSTIEVTFKSWEDDVNLVIVRQDFGGFASYKTKAWEIVNKMTEGDFDIATVEALASGYDKKGILDKIKAKIDTLGLDQSYVNNVKNAVVIDDITLQPNDVTGSLSFIIKIGDQSKTIGITSGFLTNDQKAINDVVAEFKKATKDGGFNAKNEGTSTNLLIATTLKGSRAIVASTLDGSKTHDELGFIQPLASSDIAITYVGSNSDAVAGTVIVTATIENIKEDSSTTSKKVIFKLSGLASSDQTDVDAEATSFGLGALGAKDYESKDALVAIASTLDDKDSTLPSELVGRVFASDIGFTNVILSNNVVVEYEITDDAHDDVAGTVVVKATLTKGTNFKVMKFKLSGYQNSANRETANKAAVAAAIVEFKKAAALGGLNAMDSKDGLTSSASSKNTSLPSDLAASAINSTNLGFIEPLSLTGVNVEYSIASGDTNDLTGEIIVTATIKAATDESISSIVYFKLSNYKSISEIQKVVNDAIEKFKAMNGLKAMNTKDSLTTTATTSKSLALPSVLAASTITPTNLGFTEPSSLTSVNVEYSIASGGANNSAGTIIVKVTITKTSATNKVAYFKLSGYLTSAQKAVNDAVVKFMDELKAMDTKDSLTATSASSKSSVLPSELVALAIKDPSSLGFTAPTSLTGVSVEYSIVDSSKTSYGEIIVKATIKASADVTILKIVYFKLSGYKKQSNSQIAIDQAVAKFKAADGLKAADSSISLSATAATGKGSISPGELLELTIKDPSNLGFTAPTPLTNVNVIYSIGLVGVDAAAGTLIVKATIKATTTNALEKIVYFQLEGYQTTAQKRDAKIVADAAEKFKEVSGLKAMDDQTGLTATAATGKSSILSSVLAARTITPTSLGFTEPSSLADVNVAYSIVSSDDAMGVLIVKATISKLDVIKVVYFKLSGYLINIQAAVNDVVAKFKKTSDGGLSAKNDKLSATVLIQVSDKSSINLTSINATPSPAELGIEDKIQAMSISNSIGVRYEIASSDKDVAAGTIVVKAIISKTGAISRTVYFKLSGFASTTAQGDVDRVANQFKAPSGISGGGLVAIADKNLIRTTIGVTGKGNTNVSTIPARPTAAHLGITSIINGMSISGSIEVRYEIASSDKDAAAGTVIVKVTISKVGATDQVLYFKLGGYASTTAQSDVDRVANQFKAAPSASGGLVAIAGKNLIRTTIGVTGKGNTNVSTIPARPTAANLGITSIINGMSISSSIGVRYEIASSDKDAAAGTVIVKVTISKVGATDQVLYFKLGGYASTTAQSDVDRVANQFKAASGTSGGGLVAIADKSLIRTTIGVTGKSNTNVSTISARPTAAHLGITSIINKMLISGSIEVRYEIANSDKDAAAGTIIVTVTISKVGATSKVVYFKLGGYQTTANEALAVVIEFANKFKETGVGKLKAEDSPDDLIATATSSWLASTLLPSDLSDATSSSTIGFTEPSSKPSGVVVVYTIVPSAIDDVAGTLVVKATISKVGATDQVLYFKLSGYQTTAEWDALRDVHSVVTWFQTIVSRGGLQAKNNKDNIDSITIVDKSSVTPNNANIANLTTLGVSTSGLPTTSGVNVVYAIVLGSPNVAAGTVIIKATIAKVGAITKVLYFKLSGYASTTAQSYVDSVATWFRTIASRGGLQAKNNKDNIDSITIVDKSSVTPNNANIANLTTLGVSTSGLPTPSGVNIVYAIVSGSPNAAAGTVIVKVTISKVGATDQVLYFKLNGFASTTAQSDVDMVANWFVSPFDSGLEAQNDKNNVVQSLEVNKSSVIPSSANITNLTTLGVNASSLSTPTGVNIVYAIVSGSPNAAAGTVIIKATISKVGAITQVLYFKLSGYASTTAQSNVDGVANQFKAPSGASGGLVAKADKDLINTTIGVTGKGNTNVSTISARPTATHLGITSIINGMLISNSIEVRYEIASLDKDAAPGTIIVKVTISKVGATNQVLYFKLSGYASTTAQSDVDTVATWFKGTSGDALRAEESISPSYTTIVDKLMVVPSSADISSLLNLGVTSSLPSRDGVNIVYAIVSWSPNADVGTVIIKATISKVGAITQVLYFKLSGYARSTAQSDVDSVATWFKGTSGDALRAKESDSPSYTTIVNKYKLVVLPSRVNTRNLTTLGVSASSLPTPSGVVVAYTVVSSAIDDAAGTVIIKATISKIGATSQVLYFKLGGYLKTASSG